MPGAAYFQSCVPGLYSTSPTACPRTIGSTFSILPFKSSAPKSGPRLTAANGRRIACWGHCRASVVLDDTPFQWRFLKAAVKFPILGADFLKHFRLLMDMAEHRLILLTVGAAPPTSEPAAGGHLGAAAVAARPPLQPSSASSPGLQEPWGSLLQQFAEAAPLGGQLPQPKPVASR
jgi:hypothetical protein